MQTLASACPDPSRGVCKPHAMASPVPNTRLKIGSSDWIKTDPKGNFIIRLSEADKIISKAEVNTADQPCYEVAGIKPPSFDIPFIAISIRKRCNFIKGVLQDGSKNPLSNKKIQILNFSPVMEATTGSKGRFTLEFPRNITLERRLRIKVDGQEIPPNDLVSNVKASTLTIKYREKIAESSLPQIAPIQISDDFLKHLPTNIPSGSIARREHAYKLKVFDSLVNPFPNLTVYIDGEKDTTNEAGEIIFDERKKYDCFIALDDDYRVTLRDFDRRNQVIIINVIQKPLILQQLSNYTSSKDGDIDDFTDNLVKILNKATLQRQELIRESQYYEDKMGKIKETLEQDLDNLSPEKAAYLKDLLVTLQERFLQNSLDYQDVQERTGKIINDMQRRLKVTNADLKDSEGRLEEDKWLIELLRTELILAAILSIVVVIGSIILFFVYRKTKRQQKELNTAKQQLETKVVEVETEKDKTEKAFSNVKKLSEIGQNITATLDFKYLHQTIHSNVNSLIDATVFGIGIIDTTNDIVEFTNYIEKEEVQNYISMPLQRDLNFVSLCRFEDRILIINDIVEEYPKYFNGKTMEMSDNIPFSLIFIPLKLDNKPIGIITLQSYTKNAYEHIDPTILHSLSTYIAVAYDNSQAYDVIKGKNQSITDSIRYAKTIQHAFLPHEKQMKETLGNYFVCYRAKDIVSGDFYWCHKEEEPDGKSTSYAALVDCTGHGVPGAFMSIIGINLLHEIIIERQVKELNQVLELLNEEVVSALKQAETANNDGMDAVICKLERSPDGTMELTFAGAKRPLYVIRRKSNILEELKGTRRSIGGIQRRLKDFNSTTISVEKGDLVYMLTDGFADQGSAESSKIGSEEIKRKILASSQLSISEQEKKFEEVLEDNLLQFAQRDDISILAFEA